MNITLYSTHCPKCSVLEKKLKQRNIIYTEVNDVSVMAGKGIDAVPVLEVDGKLMDYKKANDYINTL